MKYRLATGLMLAGIGSATAADVYDAIYVSDPAVCERADEDDMANVLFELQASAVAPRHAIWVGGEMTCTLVDVHDSPSPIGWDNPDGEILATARCYAAYEDFRDELVLTNSSQGINLHYGDTAEPPPPSLEIISMRADLGGESIAETDNYDGVYTVCDELTKENFAWDR